MGSNETTYFIATASLFYWTLAMKLRCNELGSRFYIIFFIAKQKHRRNREETERRL